MNICIQFSHITIPQQVERLCKLEQSNDSLSTNPHIYNGSPEEKMTMILLLVLVLLTGRNPVAEERQCTLYDRWSYQCCSWCQSGVFSTQMMHSKQATIHIDSACGMRAAAERTRLSARQQNEWSVYTGVLQRAPAVPGALRPRRSSDNSRTVETMSCMHCRGCAASVYCSQCSLGVGARWRNAAIVKWELVKGNGPMWYFKIKVFIKSSRGLWWCLQAAVQQNVEEFNRFTVWGNWITITMNSLKWRLP